MSCSDSSDKEDIVFTITITDFLVRKLRNGELRIDKLGIHLYANISKKNMCR